jgi:hypothetical protein
LVDHGTARSNALIVDRQQLQGIADRPGIRAKRNWFEWVLPLGDDKGFQVRQRSYDCAAFIL